MTRRWVRRLPILILIVFVLQPVMAMGSGDGEKRPPLTFAERVACREAIEDVLWALLNAPEFVFAP